jgi:hypothetical protein
MFRKFSSKYVQTRCPPRRVNPESYNSSKNGVSPGGTMVLNTTSAPLEVILSTVAR